MIKWKVRQFRGKWKVPSGKCEVECAKRKCRDARSCIKVKSGKVISVMVYWKMSRDEMQFVYMKVKTETQNRPYKLKMACNDISCFRRLSGERARKDNQITPDHSRDTQLTN